VEAATIVRVARDTELVIIGGGPAGCAAAVMASSLGVRSVLIEPAGLCHKLHRIASTVNVLGYGSGHEIALRAAEDVANAAGCEVLLGRSAARLHADREQVLVTLDSGDKLRAAYGVVATGVRPQLTAEVDWIVQDRPAEFTPLWEADVGALAGVEALVLGIDRPLGTVLRSHADLDARFLVLYPTAEAYKADEVRADERVVLLPTSRLELIHDRDGFLHLHVVSDDGERTFAGHHVYLNLGTRPVIPDGDVVADGSGYCPPGLQHSRVLVAGDLRAARYQRIMTAFGSGAQAALQAYYALNQVA
jgi:thioredoxin reductase (NADPH)/alkyl hydroperoxide reductase subunit F